jgi:hypothetical protein
MLDPLATPNPTGPLISRVVALASGILGAAFWIFTFWYISKLPPGDDGTGFQWLAEVPLTLIFVFSSLPAIALACTPGRRRYLAAAAFGVAGLVAFAYVWAQLLSEFNP